MNGLPGSVSRPTPARRCPPLARPRPHCRGTAARRSTCTAVARRRLQRRTTNRRPSPAIASARGSEPAIHIHVVGSASLGCLEVLLLHRKLKSDAGSGEFRLVRSSLTRQASTIGCHAPTPSEKGRKDTREVAARHLRGSSGRRRDGCTCQGRPTVAQPRHRHTRSPGPPLLCPPPPADNHNRQKPAAIAYEPGNCKEKIPRPRKTIPLARSQLCVPNRGMFPTQNMPECT